MSNELNYTAAQAYQDMKRLGVDLPMAGYTVKESTECEGTTFIGVSYEYAVPYSEMTGYIQKSKDWNAEVDEPSPIITFDLIGGQMQNDKSKGYIVGSFTYFKGEDAEMLAGIARGYVNQPRVPSMNEILGALVTAFTYGQ